MTPLTVKMIDADDKLVSTIEMPNLIRKPGQPYQPRSVRMGKKVFVEPTEDILDVCPPDEWRELIQ